MPNTVYIITFFAFLINLPLTAQTPINILDETVTVNSRSALNGNTRNVVEVNLPAGTSSYTYRVSVSKRGQVYAGRSLFDLLPSIPLNQFSLGADLAQYAISQSDGSQVDYFIFTDESDKNAFHAKLDYWICCQSFLSRVNTCSIVKKCLNKTIWFGFRNNNVSQGLDVRLEVVALVDQPTAVQSYGSGTDSTVVDSLSTIITGTVNDKDGYTNLRSQPTKEAPVKQRLYNGTSFSVVDQSGNWLLIRLTDGQTGYVHSSRVLIDQ